MPMSPEQRSFFVVTADDYGIRRTAEAILPLAQAGMLDRVAVLVRYCSAQDATALLATPVKIDLHLDLIEFLGRGEDVDQRIWKRSISFLQRFLGGHLRSKHIEEEWHSQIETFRTLFGRLPDGLNSHEHVHFFPPLFQIIIREATRLGIPFVRFGTRGYMLLRHHHPAAHLLQRFHGRNARLFPTTALVSTQYMVSLDWVQPRFDRFLAALTRARSPIELVVHPERPEELLFLTQRLPHV